MILINASNLKKTFADETLFDGVSMSVDSADKIGFVGVNGAGKSTLIKMITGEIDIDGGEIYKSKDLKIGYLDQYSVAGSEKTVWEETLTVFSDVMKIEEALDDVRFDIEHERGDVGELVKKQTYLQERFAELDGFYYKSKAKAALTGLGFTEDEINLCADKLSGGQKTRVALAKILLSDANLLSHDRYFLDRVTNRTFEIENGRFYSHSGNYSEYAAKREVERKTERRSYENTVKEINRLEGIVEQQRRWGREKNIKTAESKIKVIEKLEENLTAPQREADRTL